MKLLIADDEVQIRTGLAEGVDWTSIGFETIYTAGNGTEAWEMYKRYSPDVEITDIRMPGIDGIELSRRILGRNPFARILILSGHSDFEYAKRALQIGVADYELKPVKIRNLLSFASAARDTLMQGRKWREEQRRLIFSHWIRKTLDAATDSDSEACVRGLEQLLHEPEKGYYRILRIDLDDPPLFKPDEVRVLPVVRASEGEVLFAFSWLNGLSAGESEFLIGEERPGRFALLGRSATPAGALTDRQWLDGLERLDGYVRERLHAAVSAGISTIGKASDLPRLVREAEAACALKIATGKGSKTIYSNAPAGAGGMTPLASAAVQCDRELKEAIGRADIAMASMLLCEERERLKRLAGLTPNHALAWATDAVRLLVRTVEEMGVRFSERFGGTKTIATDVAEFSRLETLDDYGEKLLQLYREVLGELSERNGLRHSVTVRKAIEAVRGRYHEELTVEAMAEWIGITPNYFSHLFKKETGTAFREYVNEVRIAEAKKLLKTTNLLAYEITERVGFPNYKNFCYVFKRSVGCSPSEYRRVGS